MSFIGQQPRKGNSNSELPSLFSFLLEEAERQTKKFLMIPKFLEGSASHHGSIGASLSPRLEILQGVPVEETFEISTSDREFPTRWPNVDFSIRKVAADNVFTISVWKPTRYQGSIWISNESDYSTHKGWNCISNWDHYNQIYKKSQKPRISLSLVEYLSWRTLSLSPES